MGVQTTFQRIETKYMLTRDQKEKVLAAMDPFMKLDDYGRTTIRNLYYDTRDYRLARHSIEKPEYKEKLRVRSYRAAGDEDTVFVELKKKAGEIVYKRRLTMPGGNAREWLSGMGAAGKDSQIAREIAYFRDYYKTLAPRVYLSYEREAYYCPAGGDLRITFDENILARQDHLSLSEKPGGERVLPEGYTLMEIKCGSGYPLWLVRVLSEEKIYKTSFSKYGKYYEKAICPKQWPAVKQMPAFGRAQTVPGRLRVLHHEGGKKYA